MACPSNLPMVNRSLDSRTRMLRLKLRMDSSQLMALRREVTSPRRLGTLSKAVSRA